MTTREDRQTVPSLVREMLRSPVLMVWAAFLLCVPFYVSQSGIPQPGNVLIFILVPLTLSTWNGRLHRILRAPLIALILFTLWVAIVNYGWTLTTGKWGIDYYVLYPLYYIYNVCVFLVVIILFKNHGKSFLSITAWSLTLSIAFQTIASFFINDQSIRGSVFFNNPNQLGYYALLVACLIALMQPRLQLGMLRTSGTLFGCAFLAFISASRAAVGGIAVLFFFLTFTNRKVLIISLFVAVATLAFGGPITHVMDATEKRIDYRKNEDVVESRGYDRLWTYKEYLIIGAGEGDFERFSQDPSRSKEIHSSAATVLFSYGIMGAVLFSTFILRVIRGASVRNWLLVVPALVYTITHQGLRFTMLWVLLAVFLGIKEQELRTTRNRIQPHGLVAANEAPA